MSMEKIAFIIGIIAFAGPIVTALTWVYFKVQDLLQWKTLVDSHITDVGKHLDERTWQGIQQRFDRIEVKLDVALEQIRHNKE